MILVATIDGLTLEKVLKISRTFLVRIFFLINFTPEILGSGNVLAAFVEQNDSSNLL